MPTSDDDVASVAARWIQEHFPGTRAFVVSIASPKNGRIPYLSRLVKIPQAAGPADAGRAKLSQADRTVLEAVAGLPDAPTGQEIAKAAGYPYDSHLKMKLSLLRRRGLLGGGRGDTGYPLTDRAVELLSEG